MFSSSLVRPPAWSGLTPGLPDLAPASAGDADRLLAATGLQGRLFTLVTVGNSAGLFRLEQPDGTQLFLKRAPAARAEGVHRAEAIAAWLAARGQPVAAPLPGFPRRLPNGDLVTVQPFLAGTRLSADPVTLASLGAALAELHAELSAHPDRAAWEAATRRRLAELAAVRQELADGRWTAGPEPDALAALASDVSIDFLPGHQRCRPLHGDLNPGNVLMDKKGPVFLDFEDVFHSVLPPSFELAYVLERFVMVPLPDDAAALTAGQALMRGYRLYGGDPIPADLTAVLRALALRALCALAGGEQQGLAVQTDEWRKFFGLEAAARARAATLAGIAESVPCP